jgi:hypothetical protein
MPSIHSACPICDTPIQDSAIDLCEKCRWVIGIDDSVHPDIQYKLRIWSRHYYKLAIESSDEFNKINREEYNYKKIEGRLDRQRDDIDYLNGIFPQILASIQEVKSILITRENTLNRESNITATNRTSIEELDNNFSEPTEKEAVTLDSQDVNQSQREESNYKESGLTSAQKNIVSDYDHNLRDFAAKYQTRIANITKDSINSNRGSEDKIVVLEEASRGNYWIFSFADYTYLVPAEDKYINQHSYNSTSAIFEGHNYTTDYQKIQIIKPAIVSIDPNTNPQTWRLQERGELVFL